MTAAEQAEREMDRCRCRPPDWVGRVHAGAPGQASVWVCSLTAHREAAEAWVTALTGLPPEFTPAAAAKAPAPDDAPTLL